MEYAILIAATILVKPMTETIVFVIWWIAVNVAIAFWLAQYRIGDK